MSRLLDCSQCLSGLLASAQCSALGACPAAQQGVEVWNRQPGLSRYLRPCSSLQHSCAEGSRLDWHQVMLIKPCRVLRRITRPGFPESCRARDAQSSIGIHGRQIATSLSRRTFACGTNNMTATSNQYYKHGLLSLSKEHNPSGTMDAILKRLGPLDVVDMPGPSNFVKPRTVLYTMDGKKRRWDVVDSHPSVGIVLYHKDLKAALIVRQFRPAVYACALAECEAAGKPAPPLEAAFTYELCAGLVDKAKTLPEIAKEEVQEECGFSPPLEAFQQITTYHANMGTAGSRHNMFAVNVDESMRVDGGGGLQNTGEAIEVLALPMALSLEFIEDASLPKSSGLLFALMWLRSRHRADPDLDTQS